MRDRRRLTNQILLAVLLVPFAVQIWGRHSAKRCRLAEASVYHAILREQHEPEAEFDRQTDPYNGLALLHRDLNQKASREPTSPVLSPAADIAATELARYA